MTTEVVGGEVIAGGCWREVRGGFHSENRASAFIQQQLQQEAAALHSDERADEARVAPQRCGPRPRNRGF